MTPKEMKKQNLRKQKEFIDRLIARFSRQEDGYASVPYIGELFPEVSEYFQREGWSVKKAAETHKGLPIYIFSCANALMTPEEIEQAWNYEEPEEEEEYEEPENDNEPGFEEEIPNFLKMLFGMAKPD